MSYIPASTAEYLEVLALDINGAPITGLTDLRVRVRRDSDGFFFDWSDSTFKTRASVVTMNQPLAEVDATGDPGWYRVSFPGAAGGVYVATFTQSPGTNCKSVPAAADLRVDALATSSSVAALPTAVQSVILSDATPFQGARIDAAISSRSSHSAADVWASVARTLTGIGSSGIASQVTLDALPDAVWDEALSGHAVSGSAGAALALVDVAVSTRATAAGVWATAEGSPSVGTYGYAVQIGRQHVTNRLEAAAGNPGTLILYADDGTTARLTWQLRDGTGGPITNAGSSPARRSTAT